MENKCDSKLEKDKRFHLGSIIQQPLANPWPNFSNYSRDKTNNQYQTYFQSLKTIPALLNNKFTKTENLLYAISQLPQFKCYKAFTFIVHEKGSGKAQVFTSSNQSKKSNKRQITASNFYDFYLHVKKSKNKHFISAASECQILNFIGTYLAITMDFKNHTAVLCLSRNDFLLPTREEDLILHKSILIIKPYISNKLNHEHAIEKSKNAKKVIGNLPFKFSTNKKFNSINVDKNSFHVINPDFHYERIHLLGELLNTLEHELSNPLFGIKLTSKLLLKNEHLNQDNKSILEQIMDKCSISQKIIKNFHFLYNNDQTNKKIKLYKLLDEITKITKSETQGIQLIVNIAENNKDELIINGNTICLTQILFNLIINSAQSIKNSVTPINNPSIQISAKVFDKDLLLEVTDNGPGLPRNIKNKIFQPFFTTKSNGTGLGLSICKSLATKIKAEIGLNSSAMGKTSFFLRLHNTIEAL